MSLVSRWWSRLGRHPRVVTHQQYTQLFYQLPQEQRARAKLVKDLNLLRARHILERQLHRAKVRDCEALKALLPPDVLAAWKQREHAARMGPDRSPNCVARGNAVPGPTPESAET